MPHEVPETRRTALRTVYFLTGTIVNVCLLIAVPQPAPAEDAAVRSLRWYRDAITTDLPRLRAQLRSGLTPAQAEIEQSVAYTIEQNGALNAWAHVDSGTRRIHIDAAVAQYAAWAATHTELMKIPGLAECNDQYTDFLVDGYTNGRFLPQRTGLPTPEDGQPYSYMKSHPRVCPDPDPIFRQYQGLSENPAREIPLMVEFVMAHELAHQVLGHVYKNSATLAESRAEEAAADRFALRLLLHSSGEEAVVSASEVLIFFAMKDDFTLDFEVRSTHPAGGNRLQMWLEAVEEISREPQFRSILSQAGYWPKWQKFLASMREALTDFANHHPLFVVSTASETPAPPDECYLRLISLQSGHLRRFLDYGFSITSLAPGDDEYAVVLRKGAYGDQVFTTSNKFPKEFIDRYWRQGYEITALIAEQGEWAVVMSKGTGLTGQAWGTDTSDPAQLIRKTLRPGTSVTALARNGSTTAVVVSRTSQYSGQNYGCWDHGFPDAWVSQQWAKQSYVTSILPLPNDGWCVVASQTARYTAQKQWVIRSFPGDLFAGDLGAALKKGMRVQAVY